MCHGCTEPFSVKAPFAFSAGTRQEYGFQSKRDSNQKQDFRLFFHTCISSPSPLSALTKRHLLLSLPLQPAWLYKAGSSSRGLLYVSDGYGGRRTGRGRRSPEYYEESEPDEMTRVFVALFDYDPMSMSPNPDAADEELPFKEGQIIKVQFLDTTKTYRRICFMHSKKIDVLSL